MDKPIRLVARHALADLTAAMSVSPITVIEGARQVGKSTLAQQVGTERRGFQVTLDDQDALDFARTDPADFVAQAGSNLLVIDEAQRAPQLLLPLKASVDRDRRPGRFLLTGSSDLLRVRGAGDSLAGRAATVRLYPFSQSEIAGTGPEAFVTALATDPCAVTGSPCPDLVDRVIAGGYPVPVTQRHPDNGARWFADYTRRLASHDANEANQGLFSTRFTRLLTVLASQGQAELNVARIARDADIPERTVGDYLDLLDRLYLVDRLPAWSRSLRSRSVRRPKIGLLDTGLASYLARFRAAEAGLVGGREYFGALLEQFVVGELRRQATWSTEPYDLYHYREDHVSEIDVLVELSDGSLIGIEVKATTQPTTDHLKGLMTAKEHLGDRLRQAVVLHTGTTVQRRFGWLSLLPIAALWTTTA